MQVLKYHNQFAGIPLHRLTADFGESNTDKSFFRPEISTFGDQLQRLQGSTLKGVYDFPDGVDTGETIMTLVRNKGLDRAEVDAIYESVKANIDAKKEADKQLLEDVKRAQTSEEVNNAIKAIAEAQAASSSVSAE